jgi:hypothetical protein
MACYASQRVEAFVADRFGLRMIIDTIFRSVLFVGLGSLASNSSLRHQRLQFRQQDDAFLFVRVGAADHGSGGAGAGVVGQVGHVGGDVEQLACGDFHRVLKALAPVHDGGAFQYVDGGFMRLVFVRFSAASGRDGQQVHADGGGADGFGGDAFVIGEALFAGIQSGWAKFAALDHNILGRKGVGYQWMVRQFRALGRALPRGVDRLCSINFARGVGGGL